MQRQSNNFRPQFSDGECITVYLWGISQRRFEQKLMTSGAAQYDLPTAKQILEDHLFLRFGKLFADKAYADVGWAEDLKKNHVLELLTPRKKYKGDTLLSGDTFSTFVSSVRQPIECFFNWLNRLTNILSTSIVRSLSDLLLRVFGRIAAALCSLLFYS